ncbi:MAG: GntR family transcriptional regulator [Oscillospiraceae bacterium]|nr:GntR family transcriptional regulator [Oscillospiraceae bacterium]
MKKQNKQDRELKEMSTVAVKRAYDYIRDMAIDFSIHPGEQINETEVASHLEMSRVPVREALNRLLVGGFVAFDPGRGFFCRKFSESEVRELYAVRLDLEIGTVKQACQRGNEHDIASILSDWKQVAAIRSSVSQDELIQLDELFHMRIAALSGNMERIFVLQNIFERIRFVRKINIEQESRRDTFVDEHVGIIEAILKRDETLATELLEYHLGVNSQELKENISMGMLRIYAADII